MQRWESLEQALMLGGIEGDEEEADRRLYGQVPSQIMAQAEPSSPGERMLVGS